MKIWLVRGVIALLSLGSLAGLVAWSATDEQSASGILAAELGVMAAASLVLLCYVIVEFAGAERGYEVPRELQQEMAEAMDFKERFAPQAGCDYGWVREHAVKQFERTIAGIEQLESKADTIIGYCSAFSGISTVAVVYPAVRVNWLLGLCALPVVVCATTAMCYAARARRPELKPMPPHAKGAIEYAEFYGGSAQDRFIAQYYLAYVLAKVLADRKAIQVHRATCWFMASVVFLPLVVITICVAYAALS